MKFFHEFFLGFLSIFVNIMLGYSGLVAFFALVLIIPAFKAGRILQRYSNDKIKLVQSSRITIAVQTFVSIVLILDVLI